MKRRLLSFVLAFAMLLSVTPVAVFATDDETGLSLKGTGTETDPYLIEDLDDLKEFRDRVNTYRSDGKNQYRGKYFKLTADIDLNNEEWTPIGTNDVGDHTAFLGTFYGQKADGTIPTISNLHINADGGHLGFFARVGSYDEGITPTVKNITFNNVDVSSNTTTGHGGSYVAGVIANAGGNSVVSGVKVTGNVYVAGYGYVGGIVGHGYPDIDNCSVVADDGSYIHGHYWCCGGIIGYAGEGGTPITNSSVSGLDIWSAYGGAGAVAGLLNDGNKLENVSASNVEITSNSDYCMGYIAGNGNGSTMTGVTMTNVTATANGAAISATDAVATIGNKIYSNLAEALADVANGVAQGNTIQLVAGTFELGNVKFPATLDNVTIKGADNKRTVIKNSRFMSADGSSVHYSGVTIDGIVFDSSDIVFTGARGGEVTYEDWTITNCEFKNINASGTSAVHFNLASDETIENFTFTNNTINGVSGSGQSGVRANYLSGNIVVTGNDISNVTHNAIQFINVTANSLVLENNKLASNAQEGIANLYNTTANEISIINNQFLVKEDQMGICYIANVDVSGNYWGGNAPAGLPAGVTCEYYYSTVQENGILGGRVDIKNYVSLGDSMTNGYGLDGYDENSGVEDYGYGSYANQFANEFGFNHAQLAMSAMRAEDLHWLLELDYNDAAAIALTENEWNEAAWKAKFTTGDYWTWDEICTHSRTKSTTDAILATGYTAYPACYNPADRYTNDVALIAKYYQEHVAAADVITLGMGNGNFGVFMFGRIMEAIGFMGGTPADALKYDVDRAIAECPANVQHEILVLKDQLYAKVESMVGPIEDNPTLEALANTVVYTGLSYVLNYAGSVEAILQWNPDAEIILVALMNTFNDPAQASRAIPGVADATLGDLLNVVFTPLNAYIAALPTYMQATGNSVYANATFYYAEADNVECMVETYGDDFYNADGTSNRYSTIRDRFVTDIVGTAGDLGMVWKMLEGVELVDGIKLVPVTFKEICDYDDMTPEKKAVYAVNNQSKAVSIAVYLAFEDAIKNAADGAPVSISSVLGLGGLSFDLFSGVMTDFKQRTNDMDDMLTLLLALPETLSASLQNDPAVSGLLGLFARCIVGNGLGGHPSATGHNQLATAVINAYENGFTAEDQTKENLKVVIPAAYAQAYQYALDNGYIDMAKGYVGIASGAINAANTYVSTLEVPAQLLNTKALLLEEIGKTQVTLAKINALLNINALTPETWAQILAMEEEIYAHMATLEDLAAELGVVGNIAMDQIGVVANYYAGMIDAIANNAYAWVANGVTEFNTEYAALVEAAGLAADKVDPELGAAVRAYLIETPAEALAIMYAAGDDAIVELIAAAAAASDDIKVIVTAISAILDSDITAIANAVKNSNEVAAIMAQIDAVKNQIAATVDEMMNYPVSSALAYQKIINQLKGQLAILQGQLVDAILNSVDDVDPTLRPLLNKALNALKDAVRVAANYGAEYGAWFDARFDEMLGDLLALLIDNTNEFGSIAGPILGETIDNFLHYVGNMAYQKGVEILDKVENEVIPAFIDTLKDYGAQAWAQLVAKLDALGLLDAVDQAQKDLNNLYELINSYITDDLAGAYDTLLDRMAELKDNVADLIETVGNELANTSEEEIRATLAALQEKLENLYNAILALENVVNEAIHGNINTAIAMAQVALNNVAAAVADLAGVLSEDAAAAVTDLANDVKAMLNEAYVDAITDTYTVAPDSYYVAMGDSSVFGENTYAQKLAAELGLTTSQFINLSAAGMSVAETIGLVNANASEIAKADLITIGYSNNTMMEFVITQLKAATGNGEAQPMDWTALVGEKLVPHVEKALADITADMLASGVDAQYAELLSVAVEAYAYAAVSHALNYPTVVGSIHEINPDALVVIVGMYNPLAGVSVRLSSTETIEIGDYVQKLIDLANMETLAYAMLAPNTIYVDAPNVTTQAQPGEIPVVNFLMGLLMNGTDKYYATDAGHAYIAQQILNALTVTKIGLLGDADNDGVVDSYDATLILQYLADYIGKEDINYAVCDVDGDGFVDSYDVTLILQYLAEYITSFPAEIQ